MNVNSPAPEGKQTQQTQQTPTAPVQPTQNIPKASEQEKTVFNKEHEANNIADAFWSIKRDVLGSRHGSIPNDPAKIKTQIVKELTDSGISKTDANSILNKYIAKTEDDNFKSNFESWKTNNERISKVKSAGGVALDTIGEIPSVVGGAVKSVAKTVAKPFTTYTPEEAQKKAKEILGG
jgi:hypothetical protein